MWLRQREKSMYVVGVVNESVTSDVVWLQKAAAICAVAAVRGRRQILIDCIGWAEAVCAALDVFYFRIICIYFVCILYYYRIKRPTTFNIIQRHMCCGTYEYNNSYKIEFDSKNKSPVFPSLSNSSLSIILPSLTRKASCTANLSLAV